jgi:hypothetical protein
MTPEAGALGLEVLAAAFFGSFTADLEDVFAIIAHI